MKDAKWLLNRLLSMNFCEILWRIQQKILQKVEYKSIYALHKPVCEIPLKKGLKGLAANSSRIPLNPDNDNHSFFHSLDLFGTYDYQIYKKEWNAGFQTVNNWPYDEFSYNISISQREDIGDIRTNWELNRHHQFTCLAKNYYLTGDKIYLDELIGLFNDWNAKNLFLHGAEWTSVMEVGIRIVSWIYTYAFLENAFKKYGTKEPPQLEQISHGILAMVSYAVSHRSRYSSANNHLIVEMLAVGMAGIFYGNRKWLELSIKLMSKEMSRQNCPDGVNKEMSLHYQSFVMEAYAIMWIAMKKNKIEVPSLWKSYLTKMSEFLADSCGDYGETIEFGDNDNGKILDLQGKIEDHYRYVLQLSGILLEQKFTEMPLTENVCWIADKELLSSYYDKPLYKSPLVAHYKKGGYTILRSNDGKLLIALDHAELGFGSIAAHGHCDALSMQAYYCGEPLLVDKGTFNYHVPKNARDISRRTQSHNTVYVRGKEQAELLGPFLCGRRFKLESLNLTERPEKIIIKAAIKYSGIRHERIVEFDKNRRLKVEDRVDCKDSDSCQIWHIGENLSGAEGGNGFKFVFGGCNLIIKHSGQNSKYIERVQYSDSYNCKKSGADFIVELARGMAKTEFIVEEKAA